jgi:hypothetical protein
MKKLSGVLVAIALACVTVFAASKLNYGGASLALTAAGAINITPKAGQGVAIGSGGTAIKKVLSATGSLDFGATAAGACDSLTVTVTGAADGDTVALGIPNALAVADAYQSFDGFVSAADTVTVKRCNLTNATTALTNPAAAVVRATVMKF